jgi:superfamily II DNA or RNA helicase
MPGSDLFFLELYSQLKDFNLIRKFQRKLSSLEPEKAGELIKRPVVLLLPWDHQKQAFEAWKKKGRVGVVEMATATGKTLVGLMAIEELSKEGLKRGERCRALVLAHSKAILNQWRRETLDKLGLAGDIYTEYSIPVVCVGVRIEFETIQKVIRSGPQNYSADLLIVDEVHHIAAPEFSKVLNIDYRWFMGLSASPDEGERSRIIKGLNISVLFRFGLKEAIERGVLPSFEWKVHPVELSVKEEREFKEISRKITQLFNYVSNDSETISKLTNGEKSSIEDIHEFVKLIERARFKGMELPENWKRLQMLILQRRWIVHRSIPKIENAIELAKRYGKSKKVIVFAMDIESCDLIAGRVEEEVSNVFVVHSNVAKDVNEKIIEFRRADHGVLIGARMLDEGIDIPDAEIGINVSASKTRLQLIQRLGRILRKSGNRKPVFHHFVGVPSQESYINFEDGFRLLDELNWVHTMAMNLGVNMEIVEETPIDRLIDSAERMFRDSHQKRRAVPTPSYGTFRIENVLRFFDEELKQRIADTLAGYCPDHVISDTEWTEIVRRGFKKEPNDPLNILGYWWILVVGGRNPRRIREIIMSQEFLSHLNISLLETIKSQM